MRRVALVAASLLTVAMTASPGWAAQTRFKAKLTPEEEVPGPGESGASGTANIIVNETTNVVCYTLEWAGLSGPPTMVHVHEGPRGRAGPKVVDLDVSNGKRQGCVESQAGVVRAIQSNPEGHYVNIHTASHPKGAIRGQLTPE